MSLVSLRERVKGGLGEGGGTGVKERERKREWVCLCVCSLFNVTEREEK